jgi:hypothetical protein
MESRFLLLHLQARRRRHRAAIPTSPRASAPTSVACGRAQARLHAPRKDVHRRYGASADAARARTPALRARPPASLYECAHLRRCIARLRAHTSLECASCWCCCWPVRPRRSRARRHRSPARRAQARVCLRTTHAAVFAPEHAWAIWAGKQRHAR